MYRICQLNKMIKLNERLVVVNFRLVVRNKEKSLHELLQDGFFSSNLTRALCSCVTDYFFPSPKILDIHIAF